MVTFTALAKIYFTEYFCNTKVAGLGKILSSVHLYSMTHDKIWWTRGDGQNIPISGLIHWDDMDTPI